MHVVFCCFVVFPPFRLCVLVQDSYGMFSAVQLHLLPCKDDLHEYCHMWQGRTCVLRDIKVVQRVTRERLDPHATPLSLCSFSPKFQIAAMGKLQPVTNTSL